MEAPCRTSPYIASNESMNYSLTYFSGFFLWLLQQGLHEWQL
jgi:hypothetical protein